MTPARPIRRPISPRRSKRSTCPVRAARITAISGTVAISSPDSELGSRRSASDSSHHGTAISTTQYTSNGFQARSNGRR